MNIGDKVKFRNRNDKYDVWFSTLQQHYPSLDLKIIYIVAEIFPMIGMRLDGVGDDVTNIWFDENWIYVVPEPTIGFVID